MLKTTFERQGILSNTQFISKRDTYKTHIVLLKKPRRVPVGPYAVFYFECYETLWWQIQEMLRIEQGGQEQIAEEIRAYAPLLPQGCDWTATLMFEIPDSHKRRHLLAQLGYVEKTITLVLGNHVITAQPTESETRTTPEGKTSAVHFLRFPFSQKIKTSILTSQEPVTLSINHENYKYNVTLNTTTLEALKTDLTP